MPRQRRPNSAWRIFRWPLLVALASLAGLISALVGDGWFDVFSWLLLGGVFALMLLFIAGGKPRDGATR